MDPPRSSGDSGACPELGRGMMCPPSSAAVVVVLSRVVVEFSPSPADALGAKASPTVKINTARAAPAWGHQRDMLVLAREDSIGPEP